MATSFGISGLKSRLEGWRASWRVSGKSDRQVASHITLVETDHKDDALSALLENVVIPRLMSNHGGNGIMSRADTETHPRDPAAAAIDSADVEKFARLSIEAKSTELMDFTERVLHRGASVEMIYVQLLAPAARLLGRYWEEDSTDFVDVTMGLWRIQEILRELTMQVPPKITAGHGRRSALFSPMPGEQHSFGTLMVSECFQRAGWDADTLIEPTQSELIARFAGRHYDLIGLTVSCDCSTRALRSLVSTIKAVSANPQIKIMLGGRVINERPSLVAESGADATAIDAGAAVETADRLVSAKVDFFDALN
jgi:MerR family transcriptional regulator, light-induced transcriptional regulator